MGTRLIIELDASQHFAEAYQVYDLKRALQRRMNLLKHKVEDDDSFPADQSFEVLTNALEQDHGGKLLNPNMQKQSSTSGLWHNTSLADKRTILGLHEEVYHQEHLCVFLGGFNDLKKLRSHNHPHYSAFPTYTRSSKPLIFNYSHTISKANYFDFLSLHEDIFDNWFGGLFFIRKAF